MKLGLVLSKVPGYSETFIRSKISGLIGLGYQVTLFTDVPAFNDKIRSDYDVVCLKDGKGVFQHFSIAKHFARVIISGSPRLIRFLRLEIKNGRTWSRAVQNAVKSAHILSHHVDVLHFEFAALSIDREHVAKSMRARMSASIRGYDIVVYPLKHPGVYKQLWRNLDRLHYLSDGLKNRARAEGMPEHLPHQKITPAIETEYFNGRGPHINKIPVVLTVARLHWIKGLDYAIKAISVLKSRGIKVEYRIIGEGVEEVKLKFLAHQYGVQELIHFLGQKSKEEVKNELGKCDIFLMPSNEEGFCNAVLEAQSMGCLCIVTDAEGLTENVLHDSTGWVVEKRNPREMAEAIQYVLSLPPVEADEIRENAKRRVQNEFNMEKHLREWDHFYKELMNTNSKYSED